jgi:hypothetical protein
MKVSRVITASAIVAGLTAFGSASPAGAGEDPANPGEPAAAPEVYEFNWVGGTEPTTWTVTLCGVKCAHVEDSGNSITQPWSADAYVLNGYWTMFVDRKDMITCDDGTKVAAMAQYNWDANLAGIASAKNPGDCGDVPGPISGYFTLKRIS